MNYKSVSETVLNLLTAFSLKIRVA